MYHIHVAENFAGAKFCGIASNPLEENFVVLIFSFFVFSRLMHQSRQSTYP